MFIMQEGVQAQLGKPASGERLGRPPFSRALLSNQPGI